MPYLRTILIISSVMLLLAGCATGPGKNGATMPTGNKAKPEQKKAKMRVATKPIKHKAKCKVRDNVVAWALSIIVGSLVVLRLVLRGNEAKRSRRSAQR